MEAAVVVSSNPHESVEWLDNSKKDLFNLCPKQFFYRHELGLILKSSGSLTDYATPAQYGTALHASLAALYEGHGYEMVTCPCEDFNGCEFCSMNPIPASLGGSGGIPRLAAQFLLHYPVDPPINDKDPRTRSRGIEILQTYVEKYKREMFEVEAVEVPFELPFYTDVCEARAILGVEAVEVPFELPFYADVCEARATLMCGWQKESGCHTDPKHANYHEFKPRVLFTYVGRIDLLVRENGKLKPEDHKSTSRFGEMFQIQFKLSGQCTGYIVATSEITKEPCTEAGINAIRVTTRIDSVDSFMRLDTRRTPDDIAEWEAELREVFARIRDYRSRNFWPKHAPFACSAYNRICDYYGLCAAGSDETRQNMIAGSYEYRPWDPR